MTTQPNETHQEVTVTKSAESPEQSPPIPDKVARPLWIALSLIAVSAGPVITLTVIDWASWGPEVGQQTAATIVAWAGSIAAVLGLSRYAKSR
jgi:hypothetical protein